MLKYSCKYLLIILSISISCTTLNVNTTKNENYITIKSNVLYINNKKKYKCNLNIFIKRDNEIFFFITSPIGIELLKGYINKDKILIINTLKKTYHRYNYKELDKKFGIDVGYKLIEKVLLAEINDKQKELIEKLSNFEEIIRYKHNNILIETFIDKKKFKPFYHRIHSLVNQNRFSIHYTYKNETEKLYKNLILYLCIKNKKTICEQEIHFNNAKYRLTNKNFHLNLVIPKGYIKNNLCKK